MKYTRTALGLLTRQYRSVLRKCWLINVGLFALGAAGVMVPNEAMANSLCAKLGSSDFYFTNGSDCPAGYYQIISTEKIASPGSSVYGTVLGGNNVSNQSNNTVIGNLGKAYGQGVTTVGYLTDGHDDYATAIGYNAKAQGKYSTALGYNSVADEANTVSVGRFGADSATLAQMKADIDDGMYQSDFTTKYAQYNTNNRAMMLYLDYKISRMDWEEAVEDSKIEGYFRRITNVAAGTADNDAVNFKQMTDALAGYLDNTYFKVNSTGTAATAGGSDSIAIGPSAKAVTDYSIAIGQDSTAGRYRDSDPDNIINNKYATALGYSATAIGDSSTALGSGAIAASKYSTALGYSATATGDSSTALGSGARTDSLSSVALGHSAWALGDYSTALGHGARTDSLSSVALGNSAKTTGKYSTALGNYSVANEMGVVSVGRTAVPEDIIDQIWDADIFTLYELLDDFDYTSDAFNIYYDITGTSGHTQLSHDEIIKKYKLDGYSKIVNVADGVNEHDAATKGQLDTALNNYYTQSQVDSTAAKGQPIEEGSSVLSAGLVHQAGEETITGNKTFSGTNTFSGANTFNGATTFGASGSVAFNNGATVASGKEITFTSGGAIDKVLSAAVTENDAKAVVSATALRATLGDYLTSNTASSTYQTIITDLADIRSGATAGSTAIQGVQVNGSALTPDANKSVNIIITEGTTNGAISVNGSPVSVHGLATVATSGAYSDLSGTPTLATVATTGAYSDLSGTPTLATVATTGAYSDLSGTPTLATVATTGSYNDLSDKPTIPTVTSTYSATGTDAVNGTAVASALGSYLTSETAASTYLTQTNASNTYVAKAQGSGSAKKLVTTDSSGNIVTNGTATITSATSGDPSIVVDDSGNLTVTYVDIDTTYGVTSTGGLSKDASNDFAIKLATNSGLTTDANGLKILLPTGSGLALDANGLSVSGVTYDMMDSGSVVHSSTSPYSGDAYKKLTSKGYVDEGLAGKQATITGAASSITSSNLTGSMALVSDSSGKVAASDTISVSELNMLDGATSNIQGQINTINNNMFDKSNIKTAKATSDLNTTVYSTGYINDQLNYGDVEDTAGEGTKNYSKVAGISNGVVTTTAVKAFVPNNPTDPQIGQARGEAISKMWSGSGDSWTNSALTNATVVDYASWDSKNYDIAGVGDVTLLASGNIANGGVDSADMKAAAKKAFTEGWTPTTGGYTNTYLGSTVYTNDQKSAISNAVNADIEGSLLHESSTVLDVANISSDMKTKLNKYFKGVAGQSSDILEELGAANDAIYEKFLDNGSKLNTINPGNTIADNMVHLDAVIGKIETGDGRNVRADQTIGENLKALDDAVGTKLDMSAGYLKDITTATDAIKKIVGLIGGSGTSFDFSKKDIATVLSEMPSVDQSSLVHTTGNERIAGVKSFEERLNVNGGLYVNKVTGETLTGADWSSKEFTIENVPYVDDMVQKYGTLTLTLKAGSVEATTEAGYKEAAYRAIQENTASYVTNMSIAGKSLSDLDAEQLEMVQLALNQEAINGLTYSEKKEDIVSPKFTVENTSGNTRIYGTLQTDGVTTLSATNGLKFGDQTIIAKGISNEIGNGADDMLATTSAVATYVGKGDLTLQVNGTDIATTFNANASEGVTINLGSDFIKDSHVTPAAIKKHGSDEQYAITATNSVKDNLTSLANFSNEILRGTHSFDQIKLGTADPITGWATVIHNGTEQTPVQPVDTKLATEKAVADYVGRGNLSVSINGTTATQTFNANQSGDTIIDLGTGFIKSADVTVSDVLKHGSASDKAIAATNSVAQNLTSLANFSNEILSGTHSFDQIKLGDNAAITDLAITINDGVSGDTPVSPSNAKLPTEAAVVNYVGALGNLNTTTKTSIVNAVNEINTNIGTNYYTKDEINHTTAGAGLVHRTGDETIAGVKAFTDNVSVGGTFDVTGATTVGGSLGVSGLTTLSAANGLKFSGQSTSANSIITGIEATGAGSENALVTEKAVKGYVGDGSLTLTINGQAQTAYKANQNTNLAIDLGNYVTVAQSNESKGQVLFVNTDGNVATSLVTNDMLSGDIAKGKLESDVQSSLSKANSALQKENADGTSILYDTNTNKLKVGTITNNNITDGTISVAKLGSLSANNSLVVTGNDGKLTTSDVSVSSLSILNGLQDTLDGKLNRSGGAASSMTGDLVFDTGKGIKFGQTSVVNDVATTQIGNIPSSSTLVTEQAVTSYVGDAKIQMMINDEVVGTPFTANQSGNTVTVDLGDFVAKQQAAADKGKVLTVNSNTAQVEATQVSNGMLAGEITKDKFVESVRNSLIAADNALQAADIAEGSTNGTISVNNTDIKVHGLGSAAYENTSAFAAATHGHASDVITISNDYTRTGKTGDIQKNDSLDTALAKLENGLGGKQDKLTAGDNISISGNTISADIITYSAGDGLSLTDTTFAIANGGVTNDMLAGNINMAKISGLGDALEGKLDVSAFNAHTINGKALSSDPYLNGGDIKMTGYTPATSKQTISTQDTVNEAIGKLAYIVDNQQAFTAGENIQINNGVISATDTTYTVASGGGLNMNGTVLSVSGVSNSHIAENAGIATSKLALKNGTSGNTMYYDADGNLTFGKLTGAQIADNAGIAKTQLATAVQNSLTRAESAVIAGDIATGDTQGTIKVGTNEVAVAGLGSAAFTNANAYALASHSHSSQDVTLMTGYVKPASTSAIAATDSLNEAIGKLEKGLDTKQIKLTQGTGITITADGVISATGSGSGGTYYADETSLTLNTSNNTFSVKSGGITNAMLAGEIAYGKLDNQVQGLLNKAGTALQENSITSGNTAGAIRVGDSIVAVAGLADVATGGSLAASKVTEDATHRFVSDTQLAAWNNKQDAISDLTTIRSNAEAGKEAYDIVDANKTAWSNKVSSVSATSGNANGKIALTVDGVTTQVAVAGLKGAAYKEASEFAAASHNHSSSDVTNMNNYAMAAVSGEIKNTDTLNQAIGKLEKGLSEKQATLTAGSNISIVGNTISATDNDTTYDAAADGGLSINGNNEFSIATGGVSNSMLAGNIGIGKLSSDVQASLGLANTALQETDITESTAKGKIKVGTKDVAVYGLASVATGGNLDASKVTTDTTHQFVTDNDISAWNAKLDASTFNNRTVNGKKLNQNIALDGGDIALTGYTIASAVSAIDAEDTVNSAIGKLEYGMSQKQDAIIDLNTIRSRANNGQEAYTIVNANKDIWDAKVGSVTADTPTNNGSVAIKVDNTKLELAVKGLGTAAYQNEGYFALADHTHVASEINKMTGYQKATAQTYGVISTTDTLNEAIGKLEYGLSTKQGTLTAGDNITIDANGRISATGSGGAYTVVDNGGLAMEGNAFKIADDGVTNDMLIGGINMSKISGLNEALTGKLDATTFNTRTVNGQPLSSNVVLGGADITLTNYTKASEASAISNTDSVNTAIGKLEKALEGQQTIQAGKHIEIVDGKINATYKAGTNIYIDDDGTIRAVGSAAAYTAKEDGGLYLNPSNNEFSIADGGVTADMLDDDITEALGKAGTALQEDDITESTAKGKIKVGTKDVAVSGLVEVATGGNLAATKVTTDNDHLFVTSTDKSNWNSKVGTIAADTATNDGYIALDVDGAKVEARVKGLKSAAFAETTDFAGAVHTHTSKDITSLEDYAIASEAGALSTSDTLNEALGKLEKGIQSNKLKNGTNVTIGEDGSINAVDTKYSAAANGGLSLDGNNKFSIATSGVTNDMLAGNIAKGKLDSEVQGLLDKAGSSVQTVKVNGVALNKTNNTVNLSIAEGSANGTISVNGGDVAVTGLVSVATGGNLSASKVIETSTRKFVNEDQINSWTGKQDAIDGLDTIISNAEHGQSAYTTVEANKTKWNNKVGAVSAATGDSFGKIALTVDNVTSQVAVAGLGTAAAQDVEYFALADHNHVSSAINAMTGYEKSASYTGDIEASDSLNVAIAKLENGLGTKQGNLTAGTGISIDNGVISATGAGGSEYHAGAGLALDDSTKTFSVSGVTNDMLGEAIAYDSLASGVKTSLGKADTALQEDDITESTAKGKIKVGTKDVAVYGLEAVATGGNLAATKVTTDNDHLFVTSTDKSNWNSKVGTIAADTATNDGYIALDVDGAKVEARVNGLKSAAFAETTAFAAAGHKHASSDVNALTGYAIAEEVADLAETDTLNQALGKLEKSIKTNKLKAGTNVTIGADGSINATDTTYGVAENGGLSIDGNNKFSIATNGVTNSMLAGNIAKGKLDSEVQGLLGKAESALQASDISSGSSNGTIKVGTGDIAVKGLKSAAYAETTDFAGAVHTHTSKNITSLEDYAIASEAGALSTSDTLNEALGKLEKSIQVNKLKAGTNVTIGADGSINATDTTYGVATGGGLELAEGNKFKIADASVVKEMLSSSVQTSLGKADTALQSDKIINGTVNGTIKVDGRDVTVGGLGTAAYHAENYFALANHTHVASAIEAMTGYEKDESFVGDIVAGDSLNKAIAKLENGLGTKQGTLTAGTGISIVGNTISATGAGGAEYHAGSGLALDDTTKTFSVSGVTNAMLSGGITNDKLALSSGGTVGHVLYYGAGGTLTSGLLNSSNLAEDAGILKGQLSSDVQSALTNAEKAVTTDSIATGDTNGTIRVSPTKEVAVAGLGSAAYANADTFAAASHTHASNAIIAMTDYVKPDSTSAIEATDSLNAAIGKLEKGLDTKQGTLTAGANISIEDGVISATGSGAAYHAGAGLALDEGTNTFSVSGVTNAMLGEAIAYNSLAGGVKASLDKADTALQASDITTGATNKGTIKVKDTEVPVYGLAEVATGGNLAADKVTEDASHRFVTDTQTAAWSGKQDAISDLSEIRSNATSGKSAYETVEANKTAWNNKVDSIATATGEGSNGKIAVTANGVTTQIAVAGLKDGAFMDVDSSVTEGSGNLITSGAVKSYVAGIDGGSLHQAGNENVTGTKTFKVLQKFEKIITEGDDAGTYTTELDGDTLSLKNNTVKKIVLDGKDGSAAFAGLVNAGGGISTTTLVVNNGMTVTGASSFKDNVTIGAPSGSRNLTVNGTVTATGKTTLSTTGGMSFGEGQEVTSIVNSISGSGAALQKQLVTAAAVKSADDALSGRLDTVESTVSDQGTTLAQHESTLASHASQISANTSAINDLGVTVSQHDTQIANNTNDIAINKAAIAAHTTTLGEHTAAIAANATAISGLDSRVVTLENTSHNIEGFTEALGGNFDTTTHKWSAHISTDKNVTYGTLDVSNVEEAVSKVYSHIGSSANLDTIEKRTALAINNGVGSTKSVNENIEALNATVGDLGNLNTKLKNLTNGGTEVPVTVVAALNNLDATLGTIHGLAAKRGSAYKGNLAEGTTVEMHLSALDDAIGDRTTISNEKGSKGYAFSTDTMYVADVLTDLASQIGTADQLKDAPNGVSKDKTVNQNIAAVSKAVGNVADLQDTYFVSETTNLTDAVRVLDADMYKMAYAVDENRKEISNLRRKLRGGMASLSAMSALAPNSRADGNTQLSIGTGMYDSSPAVAVGAYHWLTNNLMVNAGVAWGDADDAVYRMGLTYSF